LYNVTKINGALSGVCGTDEGITTEQDTLALNAAIVQNTSNWLAINGKVKYVDTTPVQLTYLNITGNISGDSHSPFIKLNTAVGSDIGWGTSFMRAGSNRVAFWALSNEIVRFNSTGLNQFAGGTNILYANIQSLNSVSCDVKSYTNGTLYCGTDATGAGGGTVANVALTEWKNITTQYYNTTSTTPLEITQLRTGLIANKEYVVRCIMLYQGNLTTVAGELRVNATGTFNHISQALETTTSTTARYQVSSRTANIASASTATQAVNTPTPYYYNAVFNTTTGGTLYFWWYHETASATTYNQLEKGAECEWKYY
jgi:hypothetical protein